MTTELLEVNQKYRNSINVVLMAAIGYISCNEIQSNSLVETFNLTCTCDSVCTKSSIIL